jgi:hypothetical protein
MSSQIASISNINRSPTTKLSIQEDQIADSTSAGRILTQDYAEKVKQLVLLTLSERCEYGLSIAKYGSEGKFISSDITKGSTPTSIQVGVPNKILKKMGRSVRQSDNEKASKKTTTEGYSNLLKLHTHLPSNISEVGLSSRDLQDHIPVPDKYLNQPTPTVPTEIYRAQTAIVFTNSVSELPIERETIDQTGFEAKTHVFSQRPQVRPWLHVVERTPTATALNYNELDTLHMKTLRGISARTQTEKYRKARNRLGDTVTEGIFP